MQQPELRFPSFHGLLSVLIPSFFSHFFNLLSYSILYFLEKRKKQGIHLCSLFIHHLTLQKQVKTRPGVDKVKPKVWFKYSLLID